MIERQTIAGRDLSVVYLNDDFTPATRTKHSLVKVIFDDGESMFLLPPHPEGEGFNKHRAKHARPHPDHARGEADGFNRRRQQHVYRPKMIGGANLSQWAIHLLADDLKRIDNAIKTGLIAGLDNTEVARKVIGSMSLDGIDGAVEVTRQKIARLGLSAIKPRRKRRKSS